jgi:hypothetical protein
MRGATIFGPGFLKGVKMSFLRSLLLLLSVCLVLTLPYAVGHGLAAHNDTALLIGVAAGAVGLSLFALQKRLDRRSH